MKRGKVLAVGSLLVAGSLGAEVRYHNYKHDSRIWDIMTPKVMRNLGVPDHWRGYNFKSWMRSELAHAWKKHCRSAINQHLRVSEEPIVGPRCPSNPLKKREQGTAKKWRSKYVWAPRVLTDMAHEFTVYWIAHNIPSREWFKGTQGKIIRSNYDSRIHSALLPRYANSESQAWKDVISHLKKTGDWNPPEGKTERVIKLANREWQKVCLFRINDAIRLNGYKEVEAYPPCRMWEHIYRDGGDKSRARVAYKVAKKVAKWVAEGTAAHYLEEAIKWVEDELTRERVPDVGGPAGLGNDRLDDRHDRVPPSGLIPHDPHDHDEDMHGPCRYGDR
jgi:hypothetical protein